MDRTTFFDTITRPGSVFAKRLAPAQADGTNSLLDAFERHGVADPRHMANVLAQVYHETGGYMSPIKETVFAHHKNKTPTDRTVIRRLDKAFAAGQLTWVRTPYWNDGFFGRGQIQLTHKSNYRKLGDRLGVDLVANPSRALDLDVSANIAVVGMVEGHFTGRRLSEYFNGDKDDPRGARRIVNGPDGTESKIAQLHGQFLEALLAAGVPQVVPQDPLHPAEISDAQSSLRALGYHEVGKSDGKMGSRTRGAILAFRADHDLRLAPVIDDELKDALAIASPREVDPERAKGAPEDSRIVTRANAQIGLGTLGALGTVGSQVAPAVAEAEGAKAMAERVLGLIGLDGSLGSLLPWVGAAVFVGVIIYAVKARSARIEDHRTGKTP